MYRYLVLVILLLYGHSTSAHEFTPTYPDLKQSYMAGVLFSTMTLFNLRKDVTYYEIGVFDENWEKVPFAVQEKLLSVNYLEKVKVDVFIRSKDRKRAVYVCSKSKLLIEGTERTSLESRICSKFK